MKGEKSSNYCFFSEISKRRYPQPTLLLYSWQMTVSSSFRAMLSRHFKIDESEKIKRHAVIGIHYEEVHSPNGVMCSGSSVFILLRVV